MKYDFSGWATRNDLLCSDGRVIRKDAFKDNDGQTVPLVWNHQFNLPENVLGHALLENRDDGVYAYCSFNDSDSGQNAKLLVNHGDICSLSIFANKLRQQGPNVLHGDIKEVSLVLAGANPGASIQSVIRHGEESDEEAIIYTGDEEIYLCHADSSSSKEEKEEEEKEVPGKEKNNTPDKGEKKDSGKPESEETIEDVFNTLTEKQKNVVYALIGLVLEDAEKGNSEEKGKDMKHNVFDQSDYDDSFLSHADQQAIIDVAKSNNVGSFNTALSMYMEDNDALSHGIESIDQLFPEYQDVRPGAPETVTTDQGWVSKVLAKVHKSPISRIRTRQADLRNIDNLRAQGYKKTESKKDTKNFKLVHRTTDPQTIYVKSKIDRDDIVDITDFDVVSYLYNIDRANLNEELATAIMIGDGREDGDDGKISEDKIRPIWQDDDLYTIHVDVDFEKMKTELQGSETSAHFGENYIYAEAVLQSLLYAREKYKGSGLPDFYCTPHLVNIMLLARDLNGRRIYDNINELRAALNVNEIITVEQFASDRVRKDNSSKKHKLLGLVVNLADYYLGSTKGGEITHFTDFDIDFNQEKSLLETRCSGANTRVLSAIALEELVQE